MKLGIKVGDIMTKNFASIKPSSSLIDAAKEMIKKRVGSLVVIEGNKLNGIITERDIIWAMIKKNKLELENIKVKDIANRKVHTIRPGADLVLALQKMKDTGYRRLPVLVKEEVIGVLTLKDILRIQPDLFDSAQEILQIKEQAEKFDRIQKIKNGKIIEGICDECGSSDMLSSVEGRLLCQACKSI